MANCTITSTSGYPWSLAAGSHQDAGGLVTGMAVVVEFRVDKTGRHRGERAGGPRMAGVASGGACHPGQMIGMAMAGEVFAVTTQTVAAAVIAGTRRVGHGDYQGRVDLAQSFQVGGGVMAGIAVIVNLAPSNRIGGVDRRANELVTADISGMAVVAVAVTGN